MTATWLLSKVSLRGALAAAAAAAIAAAGMYVFSLHRENKQLRKDAQVQRQRAAALSDSLQKVESYTDAGKALRSVWSQTSSPTRRPDSLGSPGVEGEVKSATTIKVRPDSARARGTTTGTPKADSVRYDIRPSLAGYDARLRLAVHPPSQGLRYDLTVLANPVEATVYFAEGEDGTKKVFLDAPSAIGVEAIESSVAARQLPAAGPSVPRWRVDVPYLEWSAAGPLVGMQINRSLPISGSPLSGYAEAGLYQRLSGRFSYKGQPTTGAFNLGATLNLGGPEAFLEAKTGLPKPNPSTWNTRLEAGMSFYF